MARTSFSDPVSRLPHDADGLFRFSGIFGEAYMDGQKLGEVSQVQGAVDVARIAVAVPGSPKTRNKRGRETREGTVRFQKVDSYWEKQMRNIIGRKVEQRRRDRDAGLFNLGMFDLQVRLDDPDTLGAEVIALYNCQIWRMNLGFSSADDLIENEVPFTWEDEAFITAFEADLTGPTPSANYYQGLGPKS